jgi:hypothetical protein
MGATYNKSGKYGKNIIFFVKLEGKKPYGRPICTCGR